jgi:D-glycero-D-manno-heptose 1,7-bisphosphate phosphatase
MPSRNASQAGAGRPAVFLDRDDTLIDNTNLADWGDLGDPDLVSLLPGARELCEDLRAAGFALVVVTNQGGVARGRYTEADVRAVHERLSELLGHTIEAYRYCPYHPEATVERYRHPDHPWRKPRPGMLLDAAAELGLDLSRSWIVGDAERDCVAGLEAGCRAILLSTDPSPAGEPARWELATDLASAGRIILEAHSKAASR